ncbi:TetR/AcrR family transcriptional regulator [Nevskia soli]|uniref:TetR/AcrR family transcriptional regulator n=1 Tax=Nevskia soli TaxID=418856 RepID=UPI00068E6C3A|nr:TetR/AcrR family transcriptional regulator [Nevskia soli]
MEMSNSSRSLHGVRGESRERAIMDAVVELIAEVGYERISMDSIAARARASKTTIYRRWAGKPELVAHALRRRAEGDVAAPPDTGSIRGDLLANAEAIATSIAGSGGPSFLGLVEGIRDDPVLRELVHQQIDAASERSGATLVEHARARGEHIHAKRVPAAFDLMVSHLFLGALLRPGETGAHERGALVDDILLPLLTE